MQKHNEESEGRRRAKSRKQCSFRNNGLQSLCGTLNDLKCGSSIVNEVADQGERGTGERAGTDQATEKRCEEAEVNRSAQQDQEPKGSVTTTIVRTGTNGNRALHTVQPTQYYTEYTAAALYSVQYSHYNKLYVSFFVPRRQQNKLKTQHRH